MIRERLCGLVIRCALSIAGGLLATILGMSNLHAQLDIWPEHAGVQCRGYDEFDELNLTGWGSIISNESLNYIRTDVMCPASRDVNAAPEDPTGGNVSYEADIRGNDNGASLTDPYCRVCFNVLACGGDCQLCSQVDVHTLGTGQFTLDPSIFFDSGYQGVNAAWVDCSLFQWDEIYAFNIATR